MSSPGDQEVYEAVLATVRAGRPAALATIVSTRGSTPRKAGSRMLVDPETGLVGTVGGGCGEAEVIDAAHEVIEDGVPRLVKVDLTEDWELGDDDEDVFRNARVTVVRTSAKTGEGVEPAFFDLARACLAEEG